MDTEQNKPQHPLQNKQAKVVGSGKFNLTVGEIHKKLTTIVWLSSVGIFVIMFFAVIITHRLNETTPVQSEEKKWEKVYTVENFNVVVNKVYFKGHQVQTWYSNCIYLDTTFIKVCYTQFKSGR